MVSYNIKFPINDDLDKSKFVKLTNATKEALSSNLLLLLLTEKGQRYYMPDYGTNLLKFIFEPKDNITISDVIEELKNTVSKYIPQVEIDDVIFQKNVDDNGFPIPENQLTIKVKFTYREDTFIDNGEIELNF